MARQAVSEIYCWQLRVNGLNVYVASSCEGVMRIGLALGNQPDCTEFFRTHFPESRLHKDNNPNRSVIDWVYAALNNKPVPEKIKLDINCTPFQWDILRATALIPFGKTKTYGEIAYMVERPGAARAVGQALARNPLPLIFP